jgi:hypothetical protein
VKAEGSLRRSVADIIADIVIDIVTDKREHTVTMPCHAVKNTDCTPFFCLNFSIFSISWHFLLALKSFLSIPSSIYFIPFYPIPPHYPVLSHHTPPLPTLTIWLIASNCITEFSEMDIVYMASSINQTNPLSAKFFIFFSEMLLALRLSNGSVLPPDSWSLPPIAAASPSPSALACDSLPRSGCVSVSEPCSGTGPVKIVSSVGASDASAFLRSVLLGDYPVAIADSDDESCKEEDEDNDNEDENDEDEKNGEEKDKEDEEEDEGEDGVKIGRGKENHVSRSLSDSSRRSTPEISRSRNRSLSCSSNSSGIVGGTLIDALSAEGKEEVDDDIVDLEGRKKENRGDEEEVEKEAAKKQQNGLEKAVVEEQQNSGEKDKDGDEEDANDDKKGEGEDEGEDEEKEDEENEERDEQKEEEGEEEDVNDAKSSAHSSSKRGNPMSDEKNSAMDEGNTEESNREIRSERERESKRAMPSMKTISPHTSPRCLHSPPLKITESLRFLSVQKASSAVWSQHGGLYALMSLVHLYFTCCASEWHMKEGDMAIAMCQSVHAAVERKARHNGTTDYNDVSCKDDCVYPRVILVDNFKQQQNVFIHFSTIFFYFFFQSILLILFSNPFVSP